MPKKTATAAVSIQSVFHDAQCSFATVVPLVSDLLYHNRTVGNLAGLTRGMCGVGERLHLSALTGEPTCMLLRPFPDARRRIEVANQRIVRWEPLGLTWECCVLKGLASDEEVEEYGGDVDREEFQKLFEAILGRGGEEQDLPAGLGSTTGLRCGYERLSGRLRVDPRVASSVFERCNPLVVTQVEVGARLDEHRDERRDRFGVLRDGRRAVPRRGESLRRLQLQHRLEDLQVERRELRGVPEHPHERRI